MVHNGILRPFHTRVREVHSGAGTAETSRESRCRQALDNRHTARAVPGHMTCDQEKDHEP
jgi:hypothetical protein